jgi:hypothetical protein
MVIVMTGLMAASPCVPPRFLQQCHVEVMRGQGMGIVG